MVWTRFQSFGGNMNKPFPKSISHTGIILPIFLVDFFTVIEADKTFLHASGEETCKIGFCGAYCMNEWYVRKNILFRFRGIEFYYLRIIRIQPKCKFLFFDTNLPSYSYI